MFQHMADQTGGETPESGPTGPTAAEAEFAAARFRSLSDEIRGCAILGPRGVLAATGDLEAWAAPAAEMLAAADAAAGGNSPAMPTLRPRRARPTSCAWPASRWWP